MCHALEPSPGKSRDKGTVPARRRCPCEKPMSSIDNGSSPGRSRTRVLVAGANGYAGALAAHLVAKHPAFELAAITARSEEEGGEPGMPERMDELYPQYRVPLSFHRFDEVERERIDAAIVAYPPGPAATRVAELRELGIPVVDLCADFRFKDLATYEAWYGKHRSPDLIGKAVYGLPELNREQIAGSQLVANPGCYPTATILALAPLAREGLIDDVVVDAKSGVSGAGKANVRAARRTSFVTVTDNMQAYGIPGHRHRPEIIEKLDVLGYGGELTFVPHLVPINQGELVSCYVRPTRTVTAQELAELYSGTYASEPFVEFASTLPGVREVQNTNICRMHATVDRDDTRILVFSAIDNLWKGGASQAVQNLNLMLGLPEGLGISEQTSALGSADRPRVRAHS